MLFDRNCQIPNFLYLDSSKHNRSFGFIVMDRQTWNSTRAKLHHQSFPLPLLADCPPSSGLSLLFITSFRNFYNCLVKYESNLLVNTIGHKPDIKLETKNEENLFIGKADNERAKSNARCRVERHLAFEFRNEHSNKVKKCWKHICGLNFNKWMVHDMIRRIGLRGSRGRSLPFDFSNELLNKRTHWRNHISVSNAIKLGLLRTIPTVIQSLMCTQLWGDTIQMQINFIQLNYD